MSNKETVEKILKEIQYATVATADAAGVPWNSPVFCAVDGNNIYWSSHPGSVHSKNIAASGKAFIVVYNSKAGEGEGIGVYIQASVRALEDKDEVTHALTLLGERRGRPFLDDRKFASDGPQRIYHAKPVHIWTNDAHQDSNGDFIEDFRVEVPLL